MAEALYQIFFGNPELFLMVVLGTMMGVTFGTIPGIESLMAMSLVLPFTYGLSSGSAMLLLIGIYCGGVYGGSMTAIMFRIPGSPENAATMFDGNPMARKGLASKAIGAAIESSVIGGLLSAIAMIVGCSFIARIALEFSPMEYAFLMILAFAVIAFLGTTNILKGWISILFGSFLATIGTSSLFSVSRFTFGSNYLSSGVEFVPVLLGIFAISELIFRMAQKIVIPKEAQKARAGIKYLTLKELWRVKWTMTQGTLLGIFFGILPGIGATFSAFTCYALERRRSKHPELFGTGVLEGVVAPETANNASTGGAMIPLLTLGIPGSASAAILLSALILHGLIPGPTFFYKQIDLINVIYVGMLLSNLLIIPCAMIEVRHFIKLMYIPFEILGPILLSLCVAGSYALRNNIFDVWVMLLFGVIGYLIKRYNYSMIGLVMGILLSPMLEDNIFRSHLLYRGRFLRELFNNHPISLVLVVFLVLLLIYVSLPYIRKWGLASRLLPSSRRD